MNFVHSFYSLILWYMLSISIDFIIIKYQVLQKAIDPQCWLQSKNNNWMILRRGRSMDWLVSQSWGNRAVWLLIFHAQPQEIKKGLYIWLHGESCYFHIRFTCMASSLQSSRGVVVKDSISLVGQPLHIFESQSWAYMYRGPSRDTSAKDYS